MFKLIATMRRGSATRRGAATLRAVLTQDE
jgi:hypothetical protein